MKPILLILEGPDRVSKDTILEQNFDNMISYIPTKDGLPDYRTEQNNFTKYLNDFLSKQMLVLPIIAESSTMNIIMR